jgi:hypothetical protein
MSGLAQDMLFFVALPIIAAIVIVGVIVVKVCKKKQE